MQILITPGGAVRCIYGEAIELSAIGRLSISRGSYVEPDAAGRWFADLAPVNGPKLGPFTQRSDALRAEAKWLELHWLLPLAPT
ncbi:hypothetical protein [Lignipirellula cremea]|uniref:Uncharacterized protein n=1 Tax=Lignipirellula cremea TaxID=2528010 RepID=A0A518DRL7_9BACT|nr:hypothetical protein [Lignipirellula cremea]QDU94476.1 hypothetical protein Pla8534_22670 [Lignipirellula cremea]